MAPAACVFSRERKKNEATTIITKSASDALGSAERAVNYSVEQNLSAQWQQCSRVTHLYRHCLTQSLGASGWRANRLKANTDAQVRHTHPHGTPLQYHTKAPGISDVAEAAGGAVFHGHRLAIPGGAIPLPPSFPISHTAHLCKRCFCVSECIPCTHAHTHTRTSCVCTSHLFNHSPRRFYFCTHISKNDNI